MADIFLCLKFALLKIFVNFWGVEKLNERWLCSASDLDLQFFRIQSLARLEVQHLLVGLVLATPAPAAALGIRVPFLSLQGL